MKKILIAASALLLMSSCSSDKISDHQRFMAYNTETLIGSESYLYTTTNTSNESFTVSVDDGLGVNAKDDAVSYFNKSSYRFGVIGDSLLQFKIEFNERGMVNTVTHNGKEYEVRSLLFYDEFVMRIRYEDENGSESFTIHTTYN